MGGGSLSTSFMGGEDVAEAHLKTKNGHCLVQKRLVSIEIHTIPIKK